MVMAPSGRSFSPGASTGSRQRPMSFAAPRISQESLPPDLDIMDGLTNTALQTIDIPDDNEDQNDVAISDCSFIGSYNWLKGDAPTILVPGALERTNAM
jgi:hypothetical protein